jgi:hypothetical protein
MRQIPASFADAAWRGTLPMDGDGYLGVSFDAGGMVVRLRIPAASAKALADSIYDYLPETSHSPRSSGIPSEAGSTPLLGEKV